MKRTLQQVFHSTNFVVGFVILTAILLTVIIYPLIIRDHPLQTIGQGTFFEPGIYVSVFDTIGVPPSTLDLENAAAKRLANKLNDQQRLDIQTWLVADGIAAEDIDPLNTARLLDQWAKNYDPNKSFPGMTF